MPYDSTGVWYDLPYEEPQNTPVPPSAPAPAPTPAPKPPSAPATPSWSNRSGSQFGLPAAPGDQSWTDYINSSNPGPYPDPNKSYDQHGVIFPGRSVTQAQAEAQYQGALNAGIDQAWIDDFLARNPGDTNRIEEAYRSEQGGGGSGGSGGGSGGGSVAQSWNGNSQDPWFSPWFEQFRTEQAAKAAEAKERADSLFEMLMEKAGQGTDVSNDPVVAAQTAAYRTEQVRAQRDYLANLAEKAGPNANLRGDVRRSAETVGSSVGAFQAEAQVKELTARRQEVAQALQLLSGTLTADQNRALQEELAIIDTQLQQQRIDLSSRSLDNQMTIAQMNNDLGLRNLGLSEWQQTMYYDLLRSGALNG